MTEDIVERFRAVHRGDDGMFALADQLTDLGFLGAAMTEQQTTLRNYAVRIIEKMGVISPGEKYQLCLGIAKLLQGFIYVQEEQNGE